MNTFFKASIFLFLHFTFFTTNLEAQIYTLNDNEKIVYSVVEDKTNYAFILMLTNSNTKKISYNLVHNNKIRTGYRDFYSLDILKNKTLIAVLLQESKARDSWVIMYGNREYEYDDIDNVIVDKDNNMSLIFARYLEYGYVMVNGITNTKYSKLYDVKTKNNRYAYSYNRDDTNYINIDGKETQTPSIVDTITFSDDATKLAYVLRGEDNAKLVYNNVESSMYKSIEDVLFSYNNELLYTAVMMDNINTNEINADITSTNFNQNTQLITNTTTTMTNKVITELAIAPNNTIGFVDVPIFETIQNSVIITNSLSNEITKTTVFLDGRKYGDYDLVRNIYFSPDAKVLSFIAKENDKYYLVSSGNLSEGYNDIYFLKYFPNSRMFIYVVKNTNNVVSAIKDDKILVNADLISNIYISDSLLAYLIVKNKREYIITKGFESPSYTTINNFTFIDNGNGFAFSASKGGKQYYFTFDKSSNKKEEIGYYDYVSSIFLDSNKKPIAIVQRDGKLYMLENGYEVLSNR